MIEEKTAKWWKEVEGKKELTRSFLSVFKGEVGGVKDRFVVKEVVPPRLYRLTDQSNPIYFELTEVENGGTVVKVTYNSDVKERIAKFKAELPLKIPAIPIGKQCSACGKPVLSEFVMCPYCGEKLIKE